MTHFALVETPPEWIAVRIANIPAARAEASTASLAYGEGVDDSMVTISTNGPIMQIDAPSMLRTVARTAR